MSCGEWHELALGTKSGSCIERSYHEDDFHNQQTVNLTDCWRCKGRWMCDWAAYLRWPSSPPSFSVQPYQASAERWSLFLCPTPFSLAQVTHWPAGCSGNDVWASWGQVPGSFAAPAEFLECSFGGSFMDPEIPTERGMLPSAQLFGHPSLGTRGELSSRLGYFGPGRYQNRKMHKSPIYSSPSISSHPSGGPRPGEAVISQSWCALDVFFNVFTIFKATVGACKCCFRSTCWN